MNRKYGWIKDKKDPRDKLYTRKNKINIPDYVDLRMFASTVEDQGNIGSCTANAIVGALEILENKKNEEFFDLSRLFVYYNERMMEGTINEDSGAYIRDGIKSIATYGVCSEAYWPYNIKNYKNKPTDGCYAAAKTRTISSYESLSCLDDLLRSLAEGYPVVLGIDVFSELESDSVARTGILTMPSNESRMLGGHAVLAVGYNKTLEYIIVRNSWGCDWGQNGYFLAPFSYIQKYGDDFWRINN